MGSHLTETALAEAFGYPTAVALSADSTLLAVGTPGGEVRVWRAVDRTPVLSIQGHSGAVWGVALSGDGRLLASGSVEGTVKLWEVPGGQLLTTLRGHTARSTAWHSRETVGYLPVVATTAASSCGTCQAGVSWRRYRETAAWSGALRFRGTGS